MAKKIKQNDTGKKTAIVSSIMGLLVVLIICLICGIGMSISYEDSTKKIEATIEYGEKIDAKITIEDESGQGTHEEIVEDIPTVEEIDDPTPSVDINAGDGVSRVECPEDEECGLGAYIYAPVETATEFKDYTLGKCFNTDGAYGAQCWDLADVFWQNYAGMRAQTCGTGAAKGMINDGCWQKNAGDKFVMIWDATQIQAGDWVIFTNGQYGHVGMALGGYNNGYVTLLGQNQGGGWCEGGGSSTNIININLKSFGGAFRPKDYIVPEPAPEPEPEETAYIVKKGDTLGDISRNYCGYTGNHLFGDDGYAQALAELNGIKDRGLIFVGQEVRCK